jgi:hypothetical protein
MIGEAIVRLNYSDALQFSMIGFPLIILGIVIFPIFPRRLILTNRVFKWNNGTSWIIDYWTVIPITHLDSVLLSKKTIWFTLKDQFIDIQGTYTIDRKILSEDSWKVLFKEFRRLKVFVGNYGAKRKNETIL